MNKQNTVSLALAVVVVVVAVVLTAAGGHAAELPNHLKEDTISKDLYAASPPIVSAASVAAAKNTIASAPPVASPSVKILNAVTTGESTSVVRGKDSSTAVEDSTTAVEDSAAIAAAAAVVRNPNEAVIDAQDKTGNNNSNNNNNDEQANAKLFKLSEKSASIAASQTALSEKANKEHSVGERIEKVMPVKENTVATHAVKGGSSSSLKVAAQMVGVYQHNKR